MLKVILVFIFLGIQFNLLGQFSHLEYFFDKDPGFGNAKKLTVDANKDIEGIYKIDLSNLSKGIHSLNLRGKNVQGTWSITHSKPFLVLPSLKKSLRLIEFFVDIDPGFGKGQFLSIENKEIIDVSIIVENILTSPGMHTLYFRVLNSNSSSLTYSIPFLNLGSIPKEITHVEYYFDEDLGGDSKFLISISKADTIDLNIPVNIDNLEDGLHEVFVRVKDEKGVWSLTNSQRFKICPESEYFALVIDGIDNVSAEFVLSTNLEGEHLWYRDTTLLIDENKNFYPVNSAGAYHAIVKNKNECIIGISDTVVLTSSNNYQENISFESIIYPNPVNEEINIKTKNIFSNINIECFSLSGKWLFSLRKNDNYKGFLKIPVQDLEKGVYILKIFNEYFLEEKLFLKK